MNDNSKKYIYVFGSYRKFLEFKNYFDEQEYSLVFISGELLEECGVSKTRDQLFVEFNFHYDKNQVIEAMVSFGKGSIVGNIEAIAQVFEVIKKEYPNCADTQFIGPSGEAALIFCNKYLTYKALRDLDIPVPHTIEIFGESVGEILSMVPKDVKFPLVLKSENLSGGRGIKYILNIEDLGKSVRHFLSLGINKFILSEYVSGVEATFTVFRLGDTFMRLPTSYKNETTPEMKHPDAKVKISGVFREFDEYFEYVEKVMRKYSIYGFFSLQGVLLKKNNQYSVIFLEAAPRMTGSTPIMQSSLVGFDIFETLSRWIKERKIYFAYTKRLALQYSSYVHNGKETVKKLLENNWIVEAKYEDLSKMLYSEDSKSRIRISFFIDKKDELQEKLRSVSSICGNKDYLEDVNSVFSWFNVNHRGLIKAIDKKVLEGYWDGGAKWEFYLSSTLPDSELCSAAFGLPKIGENILLTKTHRGWELPGGHMENKETVIETLRRESLEEGGFVVSRCIVYGYRKIITTNVLYDKEQKPYPYPVSYIPHFLVTSDVKLINPDGRDVLGVGIFPIDDKEIKNSHVKEIIEIGIKQIDRIF